MPDMATAKGLDQAEYTCPMHLEVEQLGPGTCPKCGMDLEPKLASADSSAELIALRAMARRTLVAAGLSTALVIVAMGSMVGLDVTAGLSHAWQGLLQLCLAAPVVFGCGWPLMVRGVQSLQGWNLNMFTLIMVGTLTTFLFSAWVLGVARFDPERLWRTWASSAVFRGVRCHRYFGIVGTVAGISSASPNG